MSHPYKAPSPTGSEQGDGVGGGKNMPSGIRKTRSKPKVAMPASSTTSVATSTSKDCHPFLDDREKTNIDRWNDTVPKKATRPHSVPEEIDPVIQAYLEAKMSLFRSACAASSQHSGTQDDRSVCSSQS
jgi:hypothetical protein